MRSPLRLAGKMTLKSSVAGLLLAAAGPASLAAEESGNALEQLRQQIDAQTQEIERLKRNIAQQEAAVKALRTTLGGLRGRGADAGDNAKPTSIAQAPATTADTAPEPVGQAPERPTRPPEVAPIFEQPGVLTQPGQWIVEPSLQYAYSSSNRVALVGYTVIPAILIGLIDVRQVKQNTFTANLAVRRGITNRFEMEARVPYVYRFDSYLGREIASPDRVNEILTDVDGKNIGDAELIGRYQLNDGGNDSPYYIASLRFKSRTGKDPFEVRTNFTIDGARLTGGQEELPTGSGFYLLQPGLTVLVPSDPAVFFGGISYQYSFARDNVRANTVGAELEYKHIQPGGVFGFNFGMGLALNERSSFSIGYDHLSVGKTESSILRSDGSSYSVPGVRIQLGTLLLGYSYRLSTQQTINLSLGIGVTRDTPDMQLTLRVPFTL